MTMKFVIFYLSSLREYWSQACADYIVKRRKRGLELDLILIILLHRHKVDIITISVSYMEETEAQSSIVCPMSCSK